MDPEIIEYASLDKPRTAALRGLERVNRSRSISDLERRLDEIEAEIIVARRRCERAERDRLAATPSRPTPLPALGLGALVFGDMVGELLVGR